MAELQDRLDEIDRDKLVDDVVELIDEEVHDKGGLTGMALKGGYNAVKRLEGGRMIHEAVDGLLDDFSEALSPLYDDYLDDASYETFEDYLADHEQEGADALLSITDEKAEETDQNFLAETYDKLRGQAEGHVTDALPRVGRLIDKHAPRE
jgi:hypothetical protein